MIPALDSVLTRIDGWVARGDRKPFDESKVKRGGDTKHPGRFSKQAGAATAAEEAGPTKATSPKPRARKTAAPAATEVQKKPRASKSTPRKTAEAPTQKAPASKSKGGPPRSTKARAKTMAKIEALIKAFESQYGEPWKAPTQRVATANGRSIEVRPKLVDLADLITSDNPAFPQELQPRQRGARAALSEQVRNIARNLNPEMLGESSEADRGAPITDESGVVESGNGRVMALREVYSGRLPEKEAEYKRQLEAWGYDIKGMKQPALVRERVTPMSMAERRAFTVEANQSSTAALSPVERAQADARLLDAAVLEQMHGGELATAGNAPFVRAFMSKLPEGERNALVNPDGTVSQEGVRRLQSAILAKAYGGAQESNQVLGRMLESTDNEMRSATGALLDAAPAFAHLRQSIEDGKVDRQYDLSKALTSAISKTAKLRESGQSLEEYLRQGDLVTSREPAVDELMRGLYDPSGKRLAARDKVAQTLEDYATRAAELRLDQSSMFGDAPASPVELLAAARPKEVAQIRQGGDMFGLRTSQRRHDSVRQDSLFPSSRSASLLEVLLTLT